MARNFPRIMSLAAALAGLTGVAAIVSTPVEAKTSGSTEAAPTTMAQASILTPNWVVSVGQDFLGFLVTKAADGTVQAEHYSHQSHASHSSHSSHYSSR